MTFLMPFTPRKKSAVSAALVCAGAVLALSSPFVAQAGGNSSGGGGSNTAEFENWIAFKGIGELILSARPASLADQIKGHVTDGDLTSLACEPGPFFNRAKVKSLPQLPSVGSLFSLYIERQDGRIEPFTHTVACRDRKIAASYQSFVLALTRLSPDHPFAGVSFDLAKRTHDLGGAIPVVLTSRRFQLQAVGGTLEESTWYDQNGMRIFWNQLGEPENKTIFSGRFEKELLTHEIAHLFLQRALGDKYPVTELAHDVRFLATKENPDRSHEKLILSRTSEASAFIEGLADLFEAHGGAIEHPFMENDFSLHQMRKDGCYVSTRAQAETVFAKPPFQAPLQSESYVSSSLLHLFKTNRPSSDATEGKLASPVLLSYDISHDRLLSLIEAIVRERPTNVRDLAVAFDKASGSDLGHRWLREFYFIDSHTGEGLGGQFKMSREEIVIFGLRYRFCGPTENYQKSLTIVQEAEELAAGKRAKEIHAAKVSSSALKQRILSETEKYRNSFASLSKITSLETIPSRRAAVQGRLGLCSAGVAQSNEFDEMALKVYRFIESNFRTIVPLGSLASGLLAGCPGQPLDKDGKYDIQTQLSAFNLAMENAAKLAAASTVPGQTDHFNRVQEWLKTEAAIREYASSLQDIVLPLVSIESGALESK